MYLQHQQTRVEQFSNINWYCDRFSLLYIIIMEVQNILVLGGSAFLGKTFLDVLEQQEKQFRVFCLNRGNIYWNDQSMKDHPNVTQISCNRDDSESIKRIIQSLQEKLGICQFQKWKAVIDYSAYYENHIETVIGAIKNNAEKYILISTDAVYNNSSVRVKPPIKQDQFNMDWEMKLLPQQSSVTDRYGYNKLKIQMLMSKICKIPFVCLRFCDVLGPYDQFRGQQRLWSTINWILNSQKYPIIINQKIKTKKLSFISSIDAAKLVINLIERKQFPSHFYNFAFEQTLTLLQLYEELAKLLKVSPRYQTVNTQNIRHLFPASESGILCCDKAKKQLSWKPAKINDCLKKVVEFYNQAEKLYPKEKKEMEAQFTRRVINQFYPSK